MRYTKKQLRTLFTVGSRLARPRPVATHSYHSVCGNWIKTDTITTLSFPSPDGAGAGDVQYSGELLKKGAPLQVARTTWPSELEPPDAHWVETFSLDIAVLAAAATCTSRDASRGVLAGVHCNGGRTEATDGHRVYKNTSQNPGLTADIIIPMGIIKHATTLAGAFGLEGVKRGVHTGVGEIVSFCFSGGVNLMAGAIEGDYPNIDSAIPPTSSKTLEFMPAELHACLKALVPYTSAKQPLVRFFGRRAEVHNYDTGAQVYHRLPINMTTAGHAPYGLDAAFACGLLALLSHSSPALYSGATTSVTSGKVIRQGSITILIMPMRILEDTTDEDTTDVTPPGLYPEPVPPAMPQLPILPTEG